MIYCFKVLPRLYRICFNVPQENRWLTSEEVAIHYFRRVLTAPLLKHLLSGWCFSLPLRSSSIPRCVEMTGAVCIKDIRYTRLISHPANWSSERHEISWLRNAWPFLITLNLCNLKCSLTPRINVRGHFVIQSSSPQLKCMYVSLRHVNECCHFLPRHLSHFSSVFESFEARCCYFSK